MAHVDIPADLNTDDETGFVWTWWRCGRCRYVGERTRSARSGWVAGEEWRMTADATESIRLTELTSCGGCAAKWGASVLGELLSVIRDDSKDLLVGLSPSDDAAVAMIADGVALVSTTDFFPPVVDDPADYGAIAAANACSDVFAMGGDVLLALNIAAFPEWLPLPVIRQIFVAAAEVVSEAGGVVAGGHTIRSPEPIFGLAVQGVVAPGRHFTKGGARRGDALMLSKPLGTGLALASGDDDVVACAVTSMRRLNRVAAETLRQAPDEVHAVTDVTGFGLLGHGWEMATRSNATLQFELGRLPLLDSVLDLAASGLRTGGDARNRDYVGNHVTITAGETAAAIGFDPQTSGGLLAAVEPAAVERLADSGFVEVGRVVDCQAAVILQ